MYNFLLAFLYFLRANFYNIDLLHLNRPFSRSLLWHC